MTAEDDAFERLLAFYLDRAAVEVHSAHPPSGKTYQSALVRIPAKKIGNAGTRYHIDFVLQVDGLLILQELKGSSAETEGDVAKLREILRDYSVKELVQFLKPRVSRASLLDHVSEVVPSLGFCVLDSPLPTEFVCMEARPEGVAIHIGARVSERGKHLLSELNSGVET